MDKNRLLVAAGALLMVAAVAMPQEIKPVPAPAPAPKPAPVAPEDLQEIQELAREKAERMREDMEMRRGEMDAIKASVAADQEFRFAAKRATEAALQMKLQPFEYAQNVTLPRHRGSADRLYEEGQRALENRRWDEAIACFTEVATRGSARADGALYWNAYALAKLGRRDDALAAVAGLRKSYPTSRWLNDAAALELEVKQASGQPVSPESASDDDLKLMALNGLVQTDPERALPLLEKLLKSTQSPKLKERTLYVLAQSDAPRARQLLEQVARGGAGNPDLQLKAITYMGVRGRSTDNRQLLMEIYAASNDDAVKRAVMHAFLSRRDQDSLLQLVRTEKSQALRLEAISLLGATGAQAELVKLYQNESSTEVRERILQSLDGNRSAGQLLELARAEKDPKLRRTAIRAIGSDRSAQTGAALVSLYASETDPQVKRAIVDSLSHQGNARQLVELARKEPDPQAKREIVSRLSGMKSKEAADYLVELLK